MFGGTIRTVLEINKKLVFLVLDIVKNIQEFLNYPKKNKVMNKKIV